MSDPLLKVDGLCVHEGRRHLLDNVSLEISGGEILTVIGPNGGGKSTLLKAVIGAVRPSAGTIWRKPGLRIGYTPQKVQLERTMPMHVDRFLALSGNLKKGDRQKVLNVVGLESLRRVQLVDLSGGEFQRVLLARALLRSPELLVLDEPTQGLDQPGEASFYRLLSDVRAKSGAAVLMVSHDLHVVMARSDRVICLNGHVCCSGLPETVSADPSYKELFGDRADLAIYHHEHDHSHFHGNHRHG
ncbi:MAG: ATP-binding cassette domain-containing protein [Paracoccaceae bacterium]